MEFKILLGGGGSVEDEYNAIFIGGGNTYSLLHQVRNAAGFEVAIKDFADHGGVIYGGSAGAIVLGYDISTCAHLDENTMGLTMTKGLDLLKGHSIWCHYQPTDDALIQAYVARTNSSTLALAETNGLWIRGEQDYRPLSSGEIYCFTNKGKYTLTPT